MDRHLSVRRPPVDHVGVRIAEEEVPVGRPHRSFREDESGRQALDSRARRHDAIESGIETHHFTVGRGDVAHPVRPVEIQSRRTQPDEVRRRTRDRTVDPEHRELDACARLCIARNDDAVGRVESLHELSAGLAKREWQPSIDPDFGVIVDRCLEYDRGAGRGESVDAFRNRDFYPVPVKANPARRAAVFERFGRYFLPLGVIVIRPARFGSVIVSLDRLSGGLTVRAGACKIRFCNLNVAV